MATAPRKHVIICAITGTRPDVSLMAAVSMVRLQAYLMASPEPVKADMHFVPTLNDALNVVHSTAEGPDAGALVFDGTMGFAAEFAMRAMRTDVPVLAGTYPLPVIDWNRVSTQPAGEDPDKWGLVYNVQPAAGAQPDANGYLRVEPSAHLGLLWLRAGVLRDIAARHPEIVAAAGGKCAFALEGVYGGAHVSAGRRLLDLYGGPVLADPRAGASSSGPTEFGGCVGSRQVLR